MATNKLTEVAIKKAKPKEKPFKLADGGGLYLEVMPNGSKYWRMKYRFGGKEKRLAFGVYPSISLVTAREKTRLAKLELIEGNDPGEIKKQEKLKAEAIALAAKLTDLSVVVKAKAGENGKIFGSVNNIQIADEIKAAGFEVDRKAIKIIGGQSN